MENMTMSQAREAVSKLQKDVGDLLIRLHEETGMVIRLEANSFTPSEDDPPAYEVDVVIERL